MTETLFRGALVRLAGLNPETDAEVFAKWWRDSEFLRLFDGDAARPTSVSGSRAEMERRIESERPDQFAFAIRTLAGDKLIGIVGLGGIGAHGDAWLFIGIGDRDYWGKGYGTDAMRVILYFAFMELNLHRVTLWTFEYNPRAIRSYEKLGFA